MQGIRLFRFGARPVGDRGDAAGIDGRAPGGNVPPEHAIGLHPTARR